MEAHIMKNETGKTWTVVITSDRNPDEFPSEPMTLRDAMKRAQECVFPRYIHLFPSIIYSRN